LPAPPEVSLAALRALALLMEPRFFQRMRVEQQIGYVVSCRYQRCADRDGILFALQSPDVAPDALRAQCKTFLQQFAIAEEAERLATLQSRLCAQLTAASARAEKLQSALRQAHGLRDLDRASVDALTPQALRQAQAQLVLEWPGAVALETRCVETQ